MERNTKVILPTTGIPCIAYEISLLILGNINNTKTVIADANLKVIKPWIYRILQNTSIEILNGKKYCLNIEDENIQENI